MQVLDIRTIAIIFFVNSLVATLFMAALWQQSRRQFPGITLWLSSFTLLTVAFALVSLRNVIPDAASILIANTCVAAAAFILYLGLERFVACPSSQRHNYIILAVFVGLFTYFTFFRPDIAIRIVLLNITLMLMFLQSGRLMLQRVGSRLKPLSRATGILCLLFAFAGGYRIILVFFMPNPGDYLNVNPWDATGLIINQVLTFGLVLVLILMVNSRLSINHMDHEKRLARSEAELEISNRYLTQRKRAEEALRKSEALLQATGEMAKVGGWELDAETLAVNWTEETYHIHELPLGHKPPLEEAVKYFHPDERQILSDSIQRALKDGEPYDLELRFITAKGKHLWTRTKCVPDVVDGKTVRLRGTFQDITDRRLAEKLMREAEGMYRALFDRSLEFIYMHDFEGNFIDANQAALDLFGYRKEDITNINFASLLSEDQLPLAIEAVNEIRHIGHRTKMDEYRLRRKDGEYIYIATRGTAIEKDGKAFAVLGIARNITERKQAEKMLRREQVMLARTESISHIGSWEWDIATDTVTWSGELFRIFQRDPQQGAPSFAEHPAFYHPDDMALLRQAVAVAVADGKPYELELRAIRKDGATRICVARGAAEIPPDGRPVRLFGSLQDITEHKQAEEELEKSHQELRNLSVHLISLREEERKLLAREMHDELSQALTALKIDLSWLSKKLPEGQKSLAEKTTSMLKLVNSTVKAVKRISTGLRPALLDDLGLVAAMEWQAGEFQARTGIKTGLSFKPDDIIVDNERATALFRIFQEVLTNVARHAAATRIDASLRKEGGVLELSMSDNGKGIGQKMINSSKSLGLIGMRERCQHLGGAIAIRGKPGQGTTITVNLPAGEASSDKNTGG